MNSNYKVGAVLAGILAFVLSGCVAPEATTSEFGTITTTNRYDPTDRDRNPSGRTSGVGWVHRY